MVAAVADVAGVGADVVVELAVVVVAVVVVGGG